MREASITASATRELRYLITCRDIMRACITEGFRPLTQAERNALALLARAAGDLWTADWEEQARWLEATLHAPTARRMASGDQAPAPAPSPEDSACEQPTVRIVAPCAAGLTR